MKCLFRLSHNNGTGSSYAGANGLQSQTVTVVADGTVHADVVGKTNFYYTCFVFNTDWIQLRQHENITILFS